jgi:hypothetical protein
VAARNKFDDTPEGKQIVLSRALRQERLNALNDYIGFAVNKLSGLAGVVGGGADLLHPTLLPQLHHPEYFLGAGLALLAGKPVLNLVNALVKAMPK